MFKIKRVCISDKKGQKKPANFIEVIEGIGIKGDFHSGKDPKRMVSILAKEKIDIVKSYGLEINDGDFGENIITDGLDVNNVNIGDVLKINQVELKVEIIGKECKTPCIIQEKTGRCIMPEYGIFCSVLKGGIIKDGDWGYCCKQ